MSTTWTLNELLDHADKEGVSMSELGRRGAAARTRRQKLAKQKQKNSKECAYEDDHREMWWDK